MQSGNGNELTERFSAWSKSFGYESFWGIGKTGKHICLVLPTLDDAFRAIILENAGALWFIDGYAAEPLMNEQHELGNAETTVPGDALLATAEWSLLLAYESLQNGKFDGAAQRAHIASRIGYYTRNTVLTARADIIKEAALSQ